MKKMSFIHYLNQVTLPYRNSKKVVIDNDNFISTSCSLLHVPVDLAQEIVPTAIDGKLAFARQKLMNWWHWQKAICPIATMKPR
jgi:hypothetical protein